MTVTINVIKRILKYSLYPVLAGLVFLSYSNVWVVLATKDYIFKEKSDLAEGQVGLILGTSNKRLDGQPNPYFKYRMEAAAELYHTGKVRHLILSGDNRTKYYNEPQFMRTALLKLGVPDSVMTSDFAGLRTLDSIVRCKEIFGQDEFVIITQEFHCYRAVFIAQNYNLNATAFIAKSMPLHYSLKVLGRELFARTLAVIDLYILGKEPKFYGDKVDISLL